MCHRREGDARELVDGMEARRARLVLGPVLVLGVENVDERERDAAHLDGSKEEDRLDSVSPSDASRVAQREACDDAPSAQEVRGSVGRATPVAGASRRERASARACVRAARATAHVVAAEGLQRRERDGGHAKVVREHQRLAQIGDQKAARDVPQHQLSVGGARRAGVGCSALGGRVALVLTGSWR